MVLTQDADSKAQPGALLTSLLRGGYRIEVYSTFSLLSELGYIVRTRRCHGEGVVVVGNAGECVDLDSRPVKRQRLQRTRVAAGAGDDASVDDPAVAESHAALGPQFVHLDVFAPDKSFRRSTPGTPHYVVSVCAANGAPPTSAQVRQLAASERGSTLLHAVASGAEVQILSLGPRHADKFDLRDSR